MGLRIFTLGGIFTTYNHARSFRITSEVFMSPKDTSLIRKLKTMEFIPVEGELNLYDQGYLQGYKDALEATK